MKVRCPHCKQTFIGEADLAGLMVHCPHCQKSLTMPAAPPSAGTGAAAPSGLPALEEPMPSLPAAPRSAGTSAAAGPSGPPPLKSHEASTSSGERGSRSGVGRKKSDAATHMKFECPYCKQHLSVPSVAAGLMVKCPSCDNRIRAPESRKTERQAWKETDPTNPHFLKSLGLGISVGLVWYAILWPFSPSEKIPDGMLQYVASLFYSHLGCSLLNTLFFTWAISIIFLKHQKIRLQRAALLLDVLPTDLGKKIHAGNVAAFIDHVYALPVKLRDSLMVNRIRKALELFEIRQNVGDVREMLVSQSEIDIARITGSYTLVRAFLWGIPLLGFIGTVIGLSHAIGSMNFSNVDDVGKVVGAINNVTSGLGTAFDATLVGLVLALTLNFPLNALAKQEEDNLYTIDAFCNEVLMPRLKESSAAAKAVDPAAIAHSVARSLNGSQEKFLADLKQLAEQMNTYAGNLDRRMETFQQTVTEQFVTKTAEMRAQTQASLDDAVTQITKSQEMVRDVAAAQSEEMRIQTDKAVKDSLEQTVRYLETMGNATAAENEEARTQTSRVLQESSEQVARYLGGLEEGINGLNMVLKELGEKQVVINAPKKRGWFGRG